MTKKKTMGYITAPDKRKIKIIDGIEFTYDKRKVRCGLLEDNTVFIAVDNYETESFQQLWLTKETYAMLLAVVLNSNEKFKLGLHDILDKITAELTKNKDNGNTNG